MLTEQLMTEIGKWDKCESAAYYLYRGWGKNKKQEISAQNEEEEPDYRDATHGNRNAKYLMKARLYANTPKARLKKQRTELKKELNS